MLPLSRSCIVIVITLLFSSDKAQAFVGPSASSLNLWENSPTRSWKSNVIRSKTLLFNSRSQDSDETNGLQWVKKVEAVITENPKRSILFSMEQTIAGAMLGPLLDSYHSNFGVLQYDQPFTMNLWSHNVDYPALVTTWWVPPLFGLAGFLIGWLYILLDKLLMTDNISRKVTTPQILVGISFFTLQYWLSGVLFAYDVNRTIILTVMSICAFAGYQTLDRTTPGLITSLATAIGGPLIEVALITGLSATSGGYHYSDPGETGFFPLWIVPVYFLGGPANGNLARGVWNVLGQYTKGETNGVGCEVCNDSRVVPCPNCDGIGYYLTYGSSVTCPCCNGRGVVICRSCFHMYDEDPNDIESIRTYVSQFPIKENNL